MYRLILISFFISASLAITPVEESVYYKVYYLSDVDFQELKATKYQGNLDGSRSIVEYPFNGQVPEDNGGNFGDIHFSTTLKNGTLIARDTIINEDTSQNLFLYYERTFDAYIEDFKLLNFGRQRGWTQRATIHHNVGIVSGEILIAAGNKVRILAESYARA